MQSLGVYEVAGFHGHEKTTKAEENKLLRLAFQNNGKQSIAQFSLHISAHFSISGCVNGPIPIASCASSCHYVPT